jgi:hypothetical protein
LKKHGTDEGFIDFEKSESSKPDETYKKVIYYNVRLIHIKLAFLFVLFVKWLPEDLPISESSFRRAIAGRFMYPVRRKSTQLTPR